jgi:hypothetical protein
MVHHQIESLPLGTTLALVAGCSSAPASSPPVLSSSHTTGISDEMIGSQYPPMKIEKIAVDPNYGYTEKSPVVVGGGFGEGGHNTYRYLNALRGPQGQPVHYSRVGTCCSFKSANSPFGDEALLEVYEITYDGAAKPARLYFNWYDSAEILVPKGLTPRK